MCTTRAESLLPSGFMAVAAVLQIPPRTFFALPAAELSRLFATLTDISQLIENTRPLSPLFATLTRRFAPKSFPCHSCEKTPGGVPRISQAGLPCLRGRAYHKNSAGKDAAATNTVLLPKRWHAISPFAGRLAAPLCRVSFIGTETEAPAVWFGGNAFSHTREET